MFMQMNANEVLDKMSEENNFFIENPQKHLRQPLHRILRKCGAREDLPKRKPVLLTLALEPIEDLLRMKKMVFSCIFMYFP